MSASELSPSSEAWSMLALADVDPFPAYDELRKRGPVIWDPGMKCWLVLSYEICKTIETDETTFRIIPADLPDWMIDIRGGRTGLSTLTGDDHKRMRRLYMATFTNAQMNLYRDKFVLPVINYNIAQFETSGKAELFSQLTEIIPIRVILALCGLPWKDDAFVNRFLKANQSIVTWIGLGHPNDPEITSKAKAAADEISNMILPYIMERRDGTGDDLVSQIWARAPKEYGPVGPEDMIAITKDFIAAAGHTTMHALANAIYLYLSDADLRKAVTEDQETKLNALVEEAIRTLGSPQWRFRRPNHDVVLGGAKIKKDDLICCLHAAANRDPEHYECPHQVDLNRKRVNDHLAFHIGPRLCVGMPLARLEIRECLKVLIARFPNMRLDPEKEKPTFKGFSHRSYSPLHVKF